MSKPQFRIQQYNGVWFVEYRYDGDWYDLFENPSESICQVVVDALNQIDLVITQEALPGCEENAQDQKRRDRGFAGDWMDG